MTEKKRKPKTITPLSNACEHGNQAIAVHDHETGVVEVGIGRRVSEGTPLTPGSTVFHVREGVVINEYRHEGPSRSNSKQFRKGYDRIFGKRAVADKDLN